MSRTTTSLFVCVLFFVYCSVVSGENTVQQITSLPGWTGNLPSAMYSGYVTVNTTDQRALYYWYIESQNNPATDPVVLWLQGGPGCAGTWAIFQEHGPFYIQEDGTLTENTLTWTKTANIIYIDSPAGVGFSYSNTSQGLNTNDNQTAADTFNFLQGWYGLFPQYANNELLITGESYGGVYGPMLAYNILTGGDSQLLNALSGLMLGNPVIDCEAERSYGLTTQLNLYFFHGLISFADRQQWFTKGCDQNQTAECQVLFNQFQSTIGVYSPDNLYQNFCTGNGTTEFLDSVKDCHTMGQLTEWYLNQASVQNAIHARTTRWYSCTDYLLSGLNYTSDRPNMLDYYNVFFNSLKIKILIYSGDVDIDTVPHAQTQLCLSFLDRPIVSSWARWTVPGPEIQPYIPQHKEKSNITAGYTEVYDKYSYATVRGAGHEVPLYQPYFAYYLFNHFLSLPIPN